MKILNVSAHGMPGSPTLFSMSEAHLFLCCACNRPSSCMLRHRHPCPGSFCSKPRLHVAGARSSHPSASEKTLLLHICKSADWASTCKGYWSQASASLGPLSQHGKPSPGGGRGLLQWYCFPFTVRSSQGWCAGVVCICCHQTLPADQLGRAICCRGAPGRCCVDCGRPSALQQRPGRVMQPSGVQPPLAARTT